MSVWITAMVLLLGASTHAEAQDRFISKATLSSGQTVVVAEGEFEARSTGSYSVRLYEAAPAPDETTFFSSGLVRARDGAIEKVVLSDLDDDQQAEVIVIVRSVGTGSYLSAHAFSVAGDSLVFRAAAQGLAADSDPVAVLRESGEPEE